MGLPKSILGRIFLILILGCLASCTAPTNITPTTTASPTPTLPLIVPSPTLSPTLPPIEGAEPSTRVAAFYYPWYGNPDFDRHWVHWFEGVPEFTPPLDISSDFYPVLGPYSVNDPAVVAQHFAWLRQAGVGVIISSWWGQGGFEDRAVPLLLKQAERYGIRVAFHIEPHGGRSADQLVEDIQYIYKNYGKSPAFYRTTTPSLWNANATPKGLFFLFASSVPSSDQNQPVDPGYWQPALDAVHALPDSAIVVADQLSSEWVTQGHFDGLYNYITLHLDETSFAYAQGLPLGAWYIPAVTPGNSARRIGYPEETYLPRRDGATFDEQWQAALGTGVWPEMVAITSFNEWHEGTQIEPAAVGASNGQGYQYADYGALPPEGYLERTHQWVERFLAWEWPATYRVRMRVTTTSDWTTVDLVEGGDWTRLSVISTSEGVTLAAHQGGLFRLNQPLEQGMAGQKIEAVVEFLLTNVEPDGKLVFEIERGHLGWTKVELYNIASGEPGLITTLQWGNIISPGRNAKRFSVPMGGFITLPSTENAPGAIPVTSTPKATPP